MGCGSMPQLLPVGAQCFGAGLALYWALRRHTGVWLETGSSSTAGVLLPSLATVLGRIDHSAAVPALTFVALLGACAVGCTELDGNGGATAAEHAVARADAHTTAANADSAAAEAAAAALETAVANAAAESRRVDAERAAAEHAAAKRVTALHAVAVIEAAAHRVRISQQVEAAKVAHDAAAKKWRAAATASKAVHDDPNEKFCETAEAALRVSREHEAAARKMTEKAAKKKAYLEKKAVEIAATERKAAMQKAAVEKAAAEKAASEKAAADAKLEAEEEAKAASARQKAKERVAAVAFAAANEAAKARAAAADALHRAAEKQHAAELAAEAKLKVVAEQAAAERAVRHLDLVECDRYVMISRTVQSQFRMALTVLVVLVAGRQETSR